MSHEPNLDRRHQALTLELLQSIRFRLGLLLAIALLVLVGPFAGLMLGLISGRLADLALA